MTKKAARSKSTPSTSKAVHRSAATGRFVTQSTAVRSPRTTVTERNAVDNDAEVTPPMGIGDAPVAELLSSSARQHVSDHPDEETIDRLAAEAEHGVPPEKLRRRGRPSIAEDASSTYSVRLPIDLVTLTDERSAIDGVSRGETIRRALIDYLTK